MYPLQRSRSGTIKKIIKSNPPVLITFSGFANLREDKTNNCVVKRVLQRFNFLVHCGFISMVQRGISWHISHQSWSIASNHIDIVHAWGHLLPFSGSKRSDGFRRNWRVHFRPSGCYRVQR